MTHIERFPVDLSTEFRPMMAGTGLGEPADCQLLALEQHGFIAATGVYASQLDNLASMANEEAITEYCPNDPRRFGTAAAIRTWLEKGRLMIGLYDTGKRSVRIDYGNEWYWNDEGLRQIAYGWFGPEHNAYIQGADITTAYRVGSIGRQLARERSTGQDNKLRLGLALGTLVLAVGQNWHGLEPREISLETWQSNAAANHLYDELGFMESDDVPPLFDTRPTHLAVGTPVGRHRVFCDAATGQNRVADYRLFKSLSNSAISK